MADRPYITLRVQQLELLAQQHANNVHLLRKISRELEYRRTPSSKRLQLHVSERLDEINAGVPPASPSVPVTLRKPPVVAVPLAADTRRSVASHLTEEQRAVLSAFDVGHKLKVNAFAGAGKTSTLVALGSSTNRPGLYLSFNKKNADEARERFPHHVDCRTTHSLAYRSVSKKYDADKLRTPLSTGVVQQQLKLKDFCASEPTSPQTAAYRLDARQVAALVSLSVRRWLYTAHQNVAEFTIPAMGSVAFWPAQLQAELRSHVQKLSAECWQRMVDPRDPLPMSHDGYVKLWSLTGPELNSSFILLDEAQDTNPVILDVLGKQSCQVVYVGDRHQQIYEWRGAVNAMEVIKTEAELRLSQSFRFGPAIATLANRILGALGESTPLRGLESKRSFIGPTNAQAVLARTNSTLITKFIELIDSGKRVAIQGGTNDQVRLLKGLQRIREGSTTDLPELLGIRGWDSLKQFVETDEGRALTPLVRLAEAHGIPKLIACLQKCIPPEQCEVLLSTLHKAKGLEWDRVELLSDFAPRTTQKTPITKDQADEELRVLYVAITRAKSALQLPEDVAQYIGSLSHHSSPPVGAMEAARTSNHNVSDALPPVTPSQNQTPNVTVKPAVNAPRPVPRPQNLESLRDLLATATSNVPEPASSRPPAKPPLSKQPAPQGCALALLLMLFPAVLTIWIVAKPPSLRAVKSTLQPYPIARRETRTACSNTNDSSLPIRIWRLVVLSR